MTNRAQITERTAGLWTDFGKSYATRLFGEHIISTLPRFVRGKRKGEIKAILRWRRVDRGGWINEGNYHGTPVGRVETRVGQTIEAYIHECAWPKPYGAVLHTFDPSKVQAVSKEGN